MSRQSNLNLCQYFSGRPFLRGTILIWFVINLHCQVAGATPAVEIHGTQLALADQANPVKKTSNTNSLSPILSQENIDLAKSIGILPELEQWQSMKQNPSAASIAEVVSLKLELVESILIASYENRAVVNKINKEIAAASEVNAYLAEQRDRALRLNTYVNFISGGITRMVTGGLTLGSVNHIAPDTLTAIEGVIQTSLATWGVHQLRGEKRLERQGTENMLTPIFDPSSPTAANYPPSVWNYLNSSPSAAKKQPSRRQQLLDHWYSNGLYLMRNKHKLTDDQRLQHVSGTNQVTFRITNDLLQDRMAMLTDLKTVVSEMDDNLLEILRVVHH